MKPEFMVLVLWGLLLIGSLLWFLAVGWVNSNAYRTGKNVRFWNTIFFFFGPVSLLVYLPLFVKGKTKKKAEGNSAESLQLFKRGETPISFPKHDPGKLLPAKDLLIQALNRRSTDIHLEPKDNLLLTRFRIDGLLQDGPSFSLHSGLSILSSFKVLARIDIAEKRKAQDGSFTAKFGERNINFRVSTTSSFYGETMVVRVLDSEKGLLDLKEIGFLPDIERGVNSLISRPNGMILVVGASGNGKTTTLYAILNRINTGDKNIVSIEDPIEYELPNVTQIPINLKAGVDFPGSLRSILRQDPDIIMVGEIRDVETAEMAFRASLTGHLVLSTLHTTEAAGAITRLLDMDMEPYLISSSLIGILAQRLVRIPCPNCRIRYESGDLEKLRSKGLKVEETDTLYKPVGCEYCQETGYRDRIGIFELLLIDKNIKDMIKQKSSAEDIFSQAKSKGMISMKEDGWKKVRQGITTFEEVERVLQ